MYATGVQERSKGWKDTLGGHQHVVGMRLYEVTKRGHIKKRGLKTELWGTPILSGLEKWHPVKEES